VVDPSCPWRCLEPADYVQEGQRCAGHGAQPVRASLGDGRKGKERCKQLTIFGGAANFGARWWRFAPA
jgi:hypothetical protein